MRAKGKPKRVAPAREQDSEARTMAYCIEVCEGCGQAHLVCYVGAHCTHAILTSEIGVYRCPFGACFKKLENQKREGS